MPRERNTPEPHLSGAQALVAQLQALDVDVVFGIPGVHNLAIFEALRAARLKTVVVRHEQTAVFAADGYSRATGRLGVAVTTTGPGAANTAAAMGEARASRSSLLHISTQISLDGVEGRTGRFALHESPAQRELMNAVSVWSGSVARAEAIPTMVRNAAMAALGGRRGPAFVEIPFDLLDAPVEWRPGPGMEEPASWPEGALIDRAAEVLNGARRVAVWAGGGSIDAAPEIVAVAEALDAPVFTTFAGRGVIPPSHPLSVGLPPHEPAATELLKGCDAILLVGTDLDGMNTQGWRLPLPSKRVAINRVGSDARRNYPTEVILETSAVNGLRELLPAIAPRSRPTAAARISKARTEALQARKADKGSATAWRFISKVFAAIPEDCVVLADMAVAGYWTAAYHQPSAPRLLQFPLGWGTLGYALPASVGVAAAGSRALVICGDAGALFAIGELATLVQERAEVAVLVVNDSGYGMLRYDEKERFGKSLPSSDLVAPDFVKLAKAFGVQARASTPAGVTEALGWALTRKGPAVVEVKASFVPPLTTSPRWPLRGAKEARR